MKVRALEVALPGLSTVMLADPAAAILEAGTWAVSWVALTKPVTSGEPFHCMMAPETKPLPLTVSEKAGLPATTLAVESEVRVGAAAARIVKARALEAALPVLRTVMLADPAAAILEAATWAVSWVVLMKVVGRSALFQVTMELATKLLPVTVRVNAGPLAVVVAGEMLEMVGVAWAVTVKVREFDRAVPGFTTVMEATVGDIWAGSNAVSWVALTKAVETALPFHRTCEAGTKPEPLTVRLVAGLPDAMEEGLSEVMVGSGVAIVNVRLLEADVEGLVVRTDAVPAAATNAAVICAVT